MKMTLLFKEMSALAAQRELRAVYPLGLKQRQQRGLILVITLMVISILFLMLSYGWQQFISNAETVKATKRNIENYQSMRGDLMAVAYTIKNDETLAYLNQAVSGNGDEVPITIPGVVLDNVVTLRSANVGDTSGPQESGVDPVIYRELCYGNGLRTGENNKNSGGFRCRNMILTVSNTSQSIGGQTIELKQIIGFGRASK